MIMVNNPFGQDPMDFNEETAADRIGARIRNIRSAKGMSQGELGEKIGLNADRVQKYENGARKPKPDMLKRIASALDVSTLALTDPVTTSHIGAMFAMFELENTFNMRIGKTPDDQPPGLCLSVDFKDEIYKYMEEWYKVYSQTQSELEIASSEEERKEILDSYHNWEWTFPQGIVDRTEKDLQKARLRRKIEELQEAYDQLDQND
ncbi:MAG: helix-turn-helix domain-containing protein [Lachnospiraceae bacterium]|nr:helix-turn-helix domain-containing protein [Lachnospiraceae bacterium]